MAGNRPQGPSNQRPSQNPPRAQQSSALATTEQGLTLPQLLQNYSTKIQTALPKHMSAERMIRVALTVFYRTPELQAVDPLTVAGAIVQASELGLEPNGVLGHAYLVPFWNEKARRKECQLLVGYKGYIDLARRSGKVKTVNAHLVYTNDEFDCELGTSEFVKHVPFIWRVNRQGGKEPVSPDERGAIVLTYGFAKLIDEGTALEVMGISQVEKIRQNDSSAPNSPAWREHYEWMVRKTVIRQLCKLLPLSVEMHTATGLEDTAAAGLSQNLEDNLVELGKSGASYSIPADAGNGGNAGSQGSGSAEAAPGPGSAPQGQQAPPPRQQPAPQTQPPPPRQQSAPQTQPAAAPGSAPQNQGQGQQGSLSLLTTDDFEDQDRRTLEGNLRYATAKLPPPEQISNRARVNAWLARGNFTNPQDALNKSEEMKFDAEPKGV